MGRTSLEPEPCALPITSSGAERPVYLHAHPSLSRLPLKIAFAVQTYLKHYGTPEQSTLLTTDAALVTQSAKDSMVEVLDSVQSLVQNEMTKQITDLKRHRNQEHARIYQLPQEVFVEIMLAATS